MHSLRHHGLVAAMLAALLALAGCGERGGDAAAGPGPQASAGRDARQARQEAREELAAGAAAARQKAGRVASAAGDGGEPAGTAQRPAGTSDTAVMGAAGAARDQAWGTGAAGKVDDDRITSMVIKGLKADSELNPLAIDVDTRDGVVTLSGSVPSAAARARASEIAHNVKDVRSVNDQLTLRSS